MTTLLMAAFLIFGTIAYFKLPVHDLILERLPVTAILAFCSIGFALAFLVAVGDYVTPSMVGGLDGTMIGMVIASQFGLVGNWPLGAAISVTLMLAVPLVEVPTAPSSMAQRLVGPTRTQLMGSFSGAVAVVPATSRSKLACTPATARITRLPTL